MKHQNLWFNTVAVRTNRRTRKAYEDGRKARAGYLLARQRERSATRLRSTWKEIDERGNQSKQLARTWAFHMVVWSAQHNRRIWNTAEPLTLEENQTTLNDLRKRIKTNLQRRR
jgi:hypothetical protein